MIDAYNWNGIVDVFFSLFPKLSLLRASLVVLETDGSVSPHVESQNEDLLFLHFFIRLFKLSKCYSNFSQIKSYYTLFSRFVYYFLPAYLSFFFFLSFCPIFSLSSIFFPVLSLCSPFSPSVLHSKKERNSLGLLGVAWVDSQGGVFMI